MIEANCRLFFNCYDFYKLVECLSKFIDECQLEFAGNYMIIRAMDPSRICLLHMKKKTTFGNIFLDKKINDFKIALNLSDLTKILKVAKGDHKELMIDFNQEEIVAFKNKKLKDFYESRTIKTLKTLDLEIEHVPVDILDKIDYKSYVVVEKRYLDDFFREAGVYSDIVRVEIDYEGIHFRESGQMGDSEFKIKRSCLDEMSVDDVQVGSYSLVYLKNIKELITILDRQHMIKISLSTGNPIKIEIRLKSLDIILTMYLAPRVEEEDFDDEDDEDY